MNAKRDKLLQAKLIPKARATTAKESKELLAELPINDSDSVAEMVKCGNRIATVLLGSEGRIVSSSKSLGPPAAIYNSYIYNSKGTAIWFGDLNLDSDRGALLQLAQKCDTLYILAIRKGCVRERETIKYLLDEASVIVNGYRLLVDERLFIRAKQRTEYKKKILGTGKITRKR